MSNEAMHQINVTKYFIPLSEGDYDFQEHLIDYLLTDILNANKQINKLESRIKELEEKLKIAEETLIEISKSYKIIGTTDKLIHYQYSLEAEKAKQALEEIKEEKRNRCENCKHHFTDYDCLYDYCNIMDKEVAINDSCEKWE